MKSHIGSREELNIPYKGMETIVKLMSTHNELKQKIFAICELMLLQMVSELDTGQCANKDIRSPRRGGQ